jgi:hypothetical protein
MTSYLLARAILYYAPMAALICGCCGSIIQSPATIFDTAHEIEGQGEAAQADLVQCTQADAGTTKCDRINRDLCTIISKAVILENLAVDAGFQPGSGVPVNTIPPSCSNK